MKLLVDADACPVKEIIVEVAKTFQLDVIMFIDTSHVYNDGYSTVLTLDKGRDSVDFALINHLEAGDIVITQDYGVGCMALAKHAYPLNQNGLIYTNENIDMLLHSRYTSQKLRQQKIRTKGPKKREKLNDTQFKDALIHLIQNNGGEI